MTVHDACGIGVLAAVLYGLVPGGAPVRAQSDPLADLRAQAEQGDAATQYELGRRYADGRDVARDDTEAARWYRLAADQGLAQAQARLGALYADGRGVAQDYTEAVRWYRLAAGQGLAPVQARLGALYADGRSVPEDLVEAHMWFNLAAQTFSADRSLYIKARDDVAARMTPEQIAEARRRAEEWMPTPTPTPAPAPAP